jgi:hypothetical protein
MDPPIEPLDAPPCELPCEPPSDPLCDPLWEPGMEELLPPEDEAPPEGIEGVDAPEEPPDRPLLPPLGMLELLPPLEPEEPPEEGDEEPEEPPELGEGMPEGMLEEEPAQPPIRKADTALIRVACTAMTSSRFTGWLAFIALSPMGVTLACRKSPEPSLRPSPLCDRRAERALSVSRGRRLVRVGSSKFGIGRAAR